MALDNSECRQYTRKSAARLLSELHGVEIPISRLDKDCAAGRGPKPTKCYGRTLLYSEAEVMRYGETLVRPLEDQAA